ncbi:MAG: YqeG family HAD IIIA-type phosphatase [bacterium]|nr:YqeG family HAD IIIA-type phosphatase [bacterium]
MLVKPDYICKNIYDIPLEELKNNGIKGLIMDLDSTVMVSKSGKFTQETLEWFEKIKKDFSLAIATNNTKPDYVQKVRNTIDFPVIENSKKPKTDGVEKALEQLKLSPKEVAIVGDRPLTDIMVGKNINATTILVGSINAENEGFLVQAVRNLEWLLVIR